MSHRWNCPTDWEARREGERAYEWGRSRSSNPYEDSAKFGPSYQSFSEASLKRHAKRAAYHEAEEA